MKTAILFSVLLGSLNGQLFAQGKEPDARMPAKEWSELFRKDKKAAAAKYNGKLIELTGAIYVVNCNFDGSTGGLALRGINSDKPFEQLGAAVSCALKPEESKKYQRLCELARGQEVTIRGHSKKFAGSDLTDCEFVRVGPSPARSMTMAQLSAALANAQSRQKLKDATVVAKVKVLAVEEDGSYIDLIVTDAQRKTVEMGVRTDTIGRDEWKKRLKAIKPGTMLILQFDVDGPLNLLANFRILEKLPIGRPEKK